MPTPQAALIQRQRRPTCKGWASRRTPSRQRSQSTGETSKPPSRKYSKLPELFSFPFMTFLRTFSAKFIASYERKKKKKKEGGGYRKPHLAPSAKILNAHWANVAIRGIPKRQIHAPCGIYDWREVNIFWAFGRWG